MGVTLTCFNVLCCFYLLLLCKIVENMSNSITVVFKQDITDEYCDKLINAISLFEGIVKIERNVSDFNTFAAESRVRREFGEKLFEVLYPKQSK